MSSWSEVRRLAGAWHRELYPTAVRDSSAGPICWWRPKKSPVCGAYACRRAMYYWTAPRRFTIARDIRILYSNGLAEDIARFYVAHEYGHHRLHDAQASCCDDDLDA